MQLQTTFPESKFPNKYIGVIFIQIDQHLKKLFKKYKGFPIFWNMVYIPLILGRPTVSQVLIHSFVLGISQQVRYKSSQMYCMQQLGMF